MPLPSAPPEGHETLYGAEGTRWPNPTFVLKPWTPDGGYGEATVPLLFREYQEALGHYWSWAHRCVAASRLPDKVKNATRRRALRCPECGHYWRYPTHEACGYKLTEKARLMEGCDSMGCMLCARRQANRRRALLLAWADELEVARVKLHLSRDFYMLTWTVPKRDYMSVQRLQEDSTVAWRACKSAWDKHLKYLPRKRGEKVYPGVCSDAGMVAFEEVGAGGMVHVVALYYGPWHEAKALRDDYMRCVPGGRDFKIQAVGQGAGRKGRVAKAVREVCKYVCKGSVGGKDDLSAGQGKPHEFTHPLLVVLTELALLNRNRVRCYGAARGVFGEDEDEEPACRLPDECPGCGEVHKVRSRDYEEPLEAGHLDNSLWTWVEVSKDYAWVPKGWGRYANRDKPP